MHRSTRAVPNLDKCPGLASITCPLCEAMCGLQVRVDDGVPCQIRNRS
jgi:anaerobic selenocysteine-containing dehydrogenase